MSRLALVLALVAACAPASRGLRLGDPARAPVPEGVAHGELTFDGVGGTKLYAQHWRPQTGDVKAVVILHHGLADHSARYQDFAVRLVHAGYAVYAHDMRGHARSAGRRITFDEIDLLTGDLDRFVALVRTKEPGKKLFLFGHSLGGLTTALYAIEHQPDVAGVVLSAPGIALDVPAFAIGALRFAAAIAPNAPLLETPHRDFSSSKDVIAAMDHDPLIESPKGPARSSRSLIDGVARVWAHPERLTAPLLAVHGTGDKIVAPIASREIVARAGTSDRTLRLYPGLQHDLLHEPGEAVATDIVAWLDAHAGGAPVSFPAPASAHLRGDRRAMAMQLELDARGDRVRDTDENGASGGLRFRIHVGRFGYAGGLDLRAGYLDGPVLAADLHAAGIAVRAENGASFAITGGAGITRLAGHTATHAPIEAALELPLGPLHAIVRGGLAWRLSGPDVPGDAFGLADEASALAGLRLGRDRHYWPGTTAGAGPFLAAGYQRLGDAEVFGVVLGAQMWGGN
jgi:acylglycerol lipase